MTELQLGRVRLPPNRLGTGKRNTQLRLGGSLALPFCLQYDRCRPYSRYLCHDQNDPSDRFFPYARPGSCLNIQGRLTLLNTSSASVDSTSDECDEIRARPCFVVVSPPTAFVVSVVSLQSVQFVDHCQVCRRMSSSFDVRAESANAPAS